MNDDDLAMVLGALFILLTFFTGIIFGIIIKGVLR